MVEPQTAGELLARLEQDGIEHFWIAYHDYSGVGCAKTVPPESFKSVTRDGVVFAIANLDMDQRRSTPDRHASG